MNKPSIATLAAMCLCLAGCSLFPESSFELSRESRLPKWFAIPAGPSRPDVTVTLDYYTGRERGASFTLRDAKNKRKRARVDGLVKDLQPLTLKVQRPGFPEGYPHYVIITANGVTEIIEHRRMEPIFYITDDPAVRSELGVSTPRF